MTVLVEIGWWHGVPADMLDRAVASVLAQTHSDLRLVVIGDGDPPPVSATDDRLTVYTLPENRGPYFAQAVAIAASPFEWYATLGADDWLEPDHLEHLLAHRATAVMPSYIWSGDRRVSWVSECGIVRTDRLRAIGGYNPAERLGQDSLTWRLLHRHGGVVQARKATYHRTIRPDSLTTSPDTGMGSPARLAMRGRNRDVLHATRRMTVDQVRAYREALVPKRIRAEVAEHADWLALAISVARSDFECMACPKHGDGVTPLDHLAVCDDDCFDTHAYWHPRPVAVSA